MHLQKTALVLEGGGMRGMFSAGVFEAFLAHQLAFPYITAVSAGACNILSYMSAQPLRTRQIIEHYVTDKRYFGVRNWIKSGSIFGFDFIFKELPKQLLPFDYAAYRAYPGVLQVAATDIVNGESVWYDQEAMGQDFIPVRASSSMPFVAPVVKHEGRALLDGALLAPIPYQRALDAGYEKLIVVLTRNEGYRKKKGVPKFLLKSVYKNILSCGISWSSVLSSTTSSWRLSRKWNVRARLSSSARRFRLRLINSISSRTSCWHCMTTASAADLLQSIE